MQGLEDRSRDDLARSQKFGRAAWAGVEGFGVDLLAKGGGTTFGMSGAAACLPTENPLIILVGYGAGYFAGYVGTNVIVSRAADKYVDPLIYNVFNLGEP